MLRAGQGHEDSQAQERMTMTSPMTILQRPSRSAVVQLLEHASLPAADLTDAHMEHFFYCGPALAPHAIVGLELCEGDALLRSLVVKPALRGTGVGSSLVEYAESYARAHGATAIYLLTTTAEDFFRARGYVNTSRDTAPDSIRSTTEFSSLCPASSAFLFRRL